MSVVQSTYPSNIGEAVKGMIASTVDAQVDSLICDEALGIPVARAVREVLASGKLKIGIDALGFRGISIRERTLRPNDVNSAGAEIYPNGYHVGVLFEGEIWVDIQAAVTRGLDVTANADTGQLSSMAVAAQVGSPGDPNYAAAQIRIASARWMSSQATVNGLAKVRLATSLPTDTT